MNIFGLYTQTDKTKMSKLKDMAIDMNAWAIVLTETWLTPNVCDGEVKIEGFNLFRADRDSRARGGTCIYLKEELAAVSCLQYSNTRVEGLVLKIRELELILFSVYRPPDCRTRDNYFQDTLARVDEEIGFAQANSNKFSNILGFGDYNFPDITWPEGVTPNGEGIETKQAKALLSFMNSHFMSQMSLAPTHGRNCLDLVLTNNVNLISSIGTEQNDVSLTDHNLLKVITMLGPGKREKVDVTRDFYTTIINRYNLKDATESDWSKYQAVLSKNDWLGVTLHFSASQKVDHLSKIIEKAVADVFPLKRESKSGYRIPKIMKKKMNRRTFLGKKMMVTQDPECFVRYKKELRVLELEISASHNVRIAKTESNMIDKMEVNPSLFYSYARSFGKDTGKIGPLVTDEDGIVADDFGVAELLRKQYESVFSEPCTNINREQLDDFIHTTEECLDDHENNTHEKLDRALKDVEINVSVVSKAVNALSPKAAPGPDGIPTLCYKMGGEPHPVAS